MSVLIGRNGTLTCDADGLGSALGTTVLCTVTEVSFPAEILDDTDWEDVADRYLVAAGGRGTIRAKCIFDGNSLSTAPTLPSGAAASLVVTVTSGATWTTKVFITGIRYTRYTEAGVPQEIEYTMVITSNSTVGVDPVVVA